MLTREKSTPPMGAPKAAATPAAQPPETKLRLSVSLRKDFQLKAHAISQRCRWESKSGCGGHCVVYLLLDAAVPPAVREVGRDDGARVNHRAFLAHA